MKKSCPYTIHAIQWLLAAVLFCGVLLSCTTRDGSSSAAETDGVAYDWEDSAFVRYKTVERYFNDNEHDSVMSYAPIVMDFCREHEQWKWYYYAWETMIEDCVWYGDLKTANSEAQLMYDDAKQRGDAGGQAWASYLMGISYGHQSNYDESVTCLRRALDICPKDEPSELLISILYRLCENLEGGERYDELRDVLKQWRTILDQSQLPEVYDDSAVVTNAWFYEYYVNAFDYELAKKQFDRAQVMLDSILYYVYYYPEVETITLANVYTGHYRLEFERGNYEKAYEWAVKYMEYTKEQDMDQSMRMEATLNYAQVIEKLGKYKEAIDAYRQYHEFNDSLRMSENAAQLNILNKRFEVDVLKEQQEREKIEHQRTRLQLMLVIGAIIVFSLLVFIYFRHRAAKRLEAAYHQLAEKNNALVVANARAEESSHMKTAFIQQISHEIRTPLNILSGFTQLITNPDVNLDEATKAEANEKITENTDRITALVSKMLELADANSQVVIELTDRTTIGEIVAGAVSASGVEDAEGVTFSLQLSADDASREILTNMQAAMRALIQLLDNACKFKSPEADTDVTCAVATTPSQLTITVQDTGIGVPADQHERIFEEFVQLNSFAEGTGIGLTIARSLARRMGGDITLDTSYTNGARFVMILPIK